MWAMVPNTGPSLRITHTAIQQVKSTVKPSWKEFELCLTQDFTAFFVIEPIFKYLLSFYNIINIR